MAEKEPGSSGSKVIVSTLTMLVHICQAIRKDPMTVYGDGKQTRSFQYVSDLVRRRITPNFTEDWAYKWK